MFDPYRIPSLTGYMRLIYPSSVRSLLRTSSLASITSMPASAFWRGDELLCTVVVLRDICFRPLVFMLVSFIHLVCDGM